MKFKNKTGEESLFKGVFIAYLILFLNLFLIVGIGLIVLFLNGIVNYMLWIFLGGLGLVLSSGLLFYRKLKREGRTLRNMMDHHAFTGRSIEVSLLGGFASFKLGRPGSIIDNNVIDYEPRPIIPQLEDPEAVRLRELKELADLLSKSLITREEYDRVKARIFESYTDENSDRNY